MAPLLLAALLGASIAACAPAEPTPSPEPTSTPTPPAVTLTEIPPVYMQEDGGPAFPLPEGASLVSSRSTGGGWRIVATVGSTIDATAFYDALDDPAWPRAEPTEPGTRVFSDAGGTFTRAMVRIVPATDGNGSEVQVNLPLAAKPTPAPSADLEGVLSVDPTRAPTSPDPGFPEAFRPPGLTVLGEVESSTAWIGRYEGDPAVFDAVVSAAEAAARSLGEVETRYNDNRTAAEVAASGAVIVAAIVDGRLDVSVEVAK